VTDTATRRPLLVAVGVVAVALALAGGLALGAWMTSDPTPEEGSVDVGFARDMRDHHAQAVEMSFLVREGSDDPDVSQLALDILLTQQQQVGQMYAWLDAWGLPQAGSERMAWMADAAGHEGHDMSEGMPGLMPGMATNAEMQQLEAATGERAERIFLQLMIPHHEAGVDMADYAIDHAETNQVQRLAESVSVAQQAELTVLNDLLDERGGPVDLVVS
jgi:uncharacterized protein (DUF305 family)